MSISQWCHPTISPSVIPFSSCLLSFPVSGSFPVSQFFISGGQSIGASASASVLPMNIQDWFPSGLTSLILLSKGLSRVFSSTTVQMHWFFIFFSFFSLYYGVCVCECAYWVLNFVIFTRTVFAGCSCNELILTLFLGNDLNGWSPKVHSINYYCLAYSSMWKGFVLHTCVKLKTCVHQYLLNYKHCRRWWNG